VVYYTKKHRGALLSFPVWWGGLIVRFVRCVAETHCVAAEEGQWTGPYYFIFAADPQPGLIDLFDGGTGERCAADRE